MSTALALTSCEAQIAATGGQEIKSASKTGKKAPGAADGFKKELENCEAMVVPGQPEAMDGSNPNAEAGKQPQTGGVQVIPGMGCVFEGVEVPEHPMDVAQAQGQAADMPATVIPADGMPQKNLAQGQQADSTPESNARMQQTEAGGTGSAPVKTQDQILETVGAYIDQAAGSGKESGARTPQNVSAQAAAPPQGGQPPAAGTAPAGTAVTEEADVPGGMPGGERLEAGTVQKPAAPAAGKNEYAAAETMDTAPDTSSNAAADKHTGALRGETEAAAANRPQDSGMGKAEDTVADKAKDVGKQESSVKADTRAESGKAHPAAPAVEHRETAPAAKDTLVKAAPQPSTEEAAQYTKENVLRIVDKVSTQASEGRYDFDVELKPEFLGKVNIKLTMEDGVIRMQVKTDDVSVRGMLTDQTASLQNALREKGITLSSVDVTYESQASLDGGRQPFEQNDGQRRQGGMYYAHPESPGYEPAAEPYSYYVGNSSVEFLA